MWSYTSTWYLSSPPSSRSPALRLKEGKHLAALCESQPKLPPRKTRRVTLHAFPGILSEEDTLESMETPMRHRRISESAAPGITVPSRNLDRYQSLYLSVSANGYLEDNRELAFDPSNTIASPVKLKGKGLHPDCKWKELSKATGISYNNKVRISIRGLKFETFESTLARFPNTLLGDKNKRDQYYDESADEYVFQTNPKAFDAILFYYQSNGLLCCPGDVPDDIFQEQVTFFGLSDATETTKPAADLWACAKQSSQNFKLRCWMVLESPSYSLLARLLSYLSIILIFYSTLVFCFATEPSLQPYRGNKTDYQITKKIRSGILDFSNIWSLFELTAVLFLSLDFGLRVIFAPCKMTYLRSVHGKIDIISSVFANLHVFLSCFAISTNIPTWLTRFVAFMRVFRVYKFSRYSYGLRYVLWMLSKSARDLYAFYLSLIVCVLLFSTFLYHAEFEENKNAFKSVPDCFWYIIITMATVGYGDVVSATVTGKIISILTVVSGILTLVSLPSPLFLHRFKNIYESKKRKDPDDESSIAHNTYNHR